MDTVDIVRRFYDESYEYEWGRMDRHPFEFQINLRFMHRYMQKGESVLDVGGGPGRYSIHLAKRGMEVTFTDLSQGNVEYGRRMAKEMGVSLSASLQADARDLSALPSNSFDHVLLMGPLYHLLEEKDREKAISESLRCLKPGGIFYASFISSYAGMIYALREDCGCLTVVDEQEYVKAFVDDTSYGGKAFTQAYFIKCAEALELMERFALTKMHFLGSEALVASCADRVLTQPQHVIESWIDLVESVCEREDLLGTAEHFLYIGRKNS